MLTALPRRLSYNCLEKRRAYPFMINAEYLNGLITNRYIPPLIGPSIGVQFILTHIVSMQKQNNILIIFMQKAKHRPFQRSPLHPHICILSLDHYFSHKSWISGTVSQNKMMPSNFVQIYSTLFEKIITLSVKTGVQL